MMESLLLNSRERKREIFDKDSAKIERTDLYLVKVTLYNGKVIENLEPRKLFPFTDTNKFITLLDEKEYEVGLILDLDFLDDGSRKAIEECFGEFYMIPKIYKINSVYDKFGSLKFNVDSDRGTIEFSVRNRHSDIKKLHGTDRIIMRDSNDNRYEIPEYTALDAKSKKLRFPYT